MSFYVCPPVKDSRLLSHQNPIQVVYATWPGLQERHQTPLLPAIAISKHGIRIEILTNILPLKNDAFWEGLFAGAMLVFRAGKCWTLLICCFLNTEHIVHGCLLLRRFQTTTQVNIVGVVLCVVCSFALTSTEVAAYIFGTHCQFTVDTLL